MVSVAGLRGAVPIVLATFPLLAGVPNAMLIFNIVFFAVLVSVLFQGISIGWAAKWLQVNADHPMPTNQHVYLPTVDADCHIVAIMLPATSAFVGQSIIDIQFPHDALVIQLHRDNQVIIPNGGTRLEAGDRLILVVSPAAWQALQPRFADAHLTFTRHPAP